MSDRKTAPVAVTYTGTKHAVRAASESLREAEGRHGIRVINVSSGYIRTDIHSRTGISFEEYCRALGNPDFLSAEELVEVVLYCWKAAPAHLRPGHRCDPHAFGVLMRGAGTRP